MEKWQLWFVLLFWDCTVWVEALVKSLCCVLGQNTCLSLLFSRNGYQKTVIEPEKNCGNPVMDWHPVLILEEIVSVI